MRTLASLLFPLFLLFALTGCVRRSVVMPAAGTEQPTEDPPPGKVEIQVLSENEGQRWDVRVGGDLVCDTPCTRVVDAADPLELSSREGDIYLDGLDVEAPGANRALVIAEGTHHGKQVNGIVFTTLGGMGVVIAITLSAVGCSNVQERSGMCTAGLITGGASLSLTAAALWMLLDSGPRAHVLPVLRSTPAKGQTPVTVAVTPVGVVGTF